MIPRLAICLAALTLTACKEDPTVLPPAVEMTAEAVGYYCQMDLLTHDGPKGQIHLSGLPAPIFFSQVRDTIAYLHMPEQSHAVVVAYVQDMTGAPWAHPGPWLAAEDAIYVSGSDQMGGMDAPEFVPFSNKEAALVFVAKHGGHVRHFHEITAQDVLNTAISTPETTASPDIADRLRALSSASETN